MKHQDLIKYHQMTPKDLSAELSKLQQNFAELRLKTSLGQAKNTSESKNTRRDIARLKTLIRHHQLSSKIKKVS